MEKRRFIVLSGEKTQRFIVVQSLLSDLSAQQLLWFTQADSSSPILTGTITHTIDQVLGREHDVVIFDAFSGFNPDAFAALAGTIKAGGVLILLCPALAIWHQMDDPFTRRITSWPYGSADVSGRFIQHFVAHIRQAVFIEKVAFADVARIPEIAIKLSKRSKHKDSVNGQKSPMPNDGQQRVITAIKRVALSEVPAVLVVEADRGRGKSAALGMAAAVLLSLARVAQSKLTIFVIAPTLKTVDVLFHHAQDAYSDHVSLRFIAPDAALQTLPTADLVLIDEAAAIPAALLAAYLKHYPRIVFATTVQGYEGTGRGFSLRFRQVLDQYCPQWQIEYLQQAIRYQAYDPLERFIFRSLLLGSISSNNLSDSLAHDLKSFTLDDCVIQRIDRDALLANPALLNALFDLLVLAHYQTRPTDLRHLLDGKNVAIYAVFWQKMVVATCLMVNEGGFDNELAQAIYYGKRRPQGHLVAQSLAFHAGLADAPLLVTERVMRIVVHPEMQQRGIASLLLAKIEQQIVARIDRNNAIDYLSTSFAATDKMIAFWHKQGFKAVHMGLKRDASSGCHSLIMLKPLSHKGRLLLASAQQQFYLHLPLLLEEALHDVEQVIIVALLLEVQQIEKTNEAAGQDNNALSVLDKADLQSFANGYRGYAFCLYAIRKLLHLPCVQERYLALLPMQQQRLLQQRVMAKLPIATVVNTLCLGGKKALDKQLRCAIKGILEQDHDYFFTG